MDLEQRLLSVLSRMEAFLDKYEKKGEAIEISKDLSLDNFDQNNHCVTKWFTSREVPANEETKEFYRNYFEDITEHYFMVTLTFAPSIVNKLDFIGQHKILEDCFNLLDNKLIKYVACMEKHKSEILHGHIMLSNTNAHVLETILHYMKHKLTDSKKLEPAVKYNPIKSTTLDLRRAYDYIFDDKPNHPKYKYIKILI